MKQFKWEELRMVKRCLPLAVMALAALTISACGGSANSTNATSAEPAASQGSESTGESSSSSGEIAASGAEREKKITLVHCFDAVPWCAAFRKNFTPVVEKAGIKVTTLLNAFSPEEEAAQIEQAISEDPGAIVVFPASDQAAVPALLRVKAAGIPLILLTSPPDPAAKPAATMSIYGDPEEMGKKPAEKMFEEFERQGKKSGNILMFTGVASQNVVIDEVAAFKKVVAEHPGFKVIGEYDTQWDQQKAQEAASQAFAQDQGNGGIQGVYASSDAIMAGAIQAAKSLHMNFGGNGVVGTSAACFPIGLENMRAGYEAMAGSQSPIEEGEETGRIIDEWFEGKELPVTSILAQHEITPANLEETEASCEF